ncbi:hypothetical protein BX666DRAFT_200379 [Dichotomocladium elegans]|nr:hypothetical protein BX666DRAFT_200379 [Dichotomocladium elegans]
MSGFKDCSSRQVSDELSHSTTSRRLARQASQDVLRSRQQFRLPTPMSISKSTHVSPSRSRMSDGSLNDDDQAAQSPCSVPRFSVSSSTSSIQTTLTTPRSSLSTAAHSPVTMLGSPKDKEGFVIGQRVTVESMNLSGTLRFLGTTRFKTGIWSGIELDVQGTGKNDGSVNG